MASGTASSMLSSNSPGRVNVLFVAHDSQLYGAQMSLLDILRKIDRSRFAPLVLVPSAGPFTAALNELGIPCISGVVRRWIFEPRSLALWDILRRPWRLLRHPYVLAFLSLVSFPLRLLLISLIVRRQGIRLIYSNTATVLDGAIAARLCHIPHVWHLREPIAGNSDLASPVAVNWLPRFIVRWSAVVMVNSKALAYQFFGGNPSSKVQVIHNGVDLNQFQSPEAVLNFPLQLVHKPIVAICGAVQERKDVLTFVRSAALIKKTHPNVHYLIIGDGPVSYFHKVRQEVMKYGLENKVHFLGYRNDIPQLLASISVLVSSAIDEPFGRTIIEAMAAGKPVVATRSGGPQEIIEEGGNGFLVEVGDDVAMASRIAELLDDPEKMDAMGQAARLRATRFFDLGLSVKHIESIFSDVLIKAGY
jgi:glycosyltransferase involved in cell wall biosynthesis